MTFFYTRLRLNSSGPWGSHNNIRLNFIIEDGNFFRTDILILLYLLSPDPLPI